MFRGFNLSLENTGEFSELGEIIKAGENIFKNNKLKIKNTLDDYLLNNKQLDGNKIIEEWFPEVKAHIFLSHSHEDEKLALILAGLFNIFFNIDTFIDSAVWGYSDDLLKQLDNKYCKNSINSSSYNYEKRNYSTAHVHMMLSTSLNKMIDNCECVMFLNTPNSITTYDEINNKTKSPWIFLEICTSLIIQKKTPSRLKRKIKVFSSKEMAMLSENAQQQLSIDYNVELSHFTKLNSEDLLKWINTAIKNDTPEKALDNLYIQHPLNKKFFSNGR